MKYRACITLASLLAAAAPAAGAKPFTGTIVYTQSATGKNAKVFDSVAAKKITVTIGGNAYRQDENGGVNDGSMIIRGGAKDALRLDHRKKTSELGIGKKIDDMDPKVKRYMPDHFSTPLKDTGETEVIAGFQTKKYRVLKSPFVAAEATAYIWVAEDLKLGRHRYDFSFEAHRVTAPLPQSIPVEKGAVLKAEVEEDGTTVTVAVTRIDRAAPAAALFAKPADYSGDDFPARPKPLPAPTGPVPDVAKLAPAMTNAAGMKLVLIKPGTFTMGSPESEQGRKKNEARHEVTITRAYYLAATEVTQAQWKAVMGAHAPSHFKGENLPVEKITWRQAVEFCKRLSEKEGRTYRLPTEAEWEYAARAGDAAAPESRRAHRDWLKDKAWTYATAGYKSHPVGELKANAWGLHDMLGNVAEFTLSGMGEYPRGKATDPQGMDSGTKVVRGGGWISNEQATRYAARTPYPETDSKSTIGFRVLCEPK